MRTLDSSIRFYTLMIFVISTCLSNPQNNELLLVSSFIDLKKQCTKNYIESLTHL